MSPPRRKKTVGGLQPAASSGNWPRPALAGHRTSAGGGESRRPQAVSNPRGIEAGRSRRLKPAPTHHHRAFCHPDRGDRDPCFLVIPSEVAGGHRRGSWAGADSGRRDGPTPRFLVATLLGMTGRFRVIRSESDYWQPSIAVPDQVPEECRHPMSSRVNGADAPGTLSSRTWPKATSFTVIPSEVAGGHRRGIHSTRGVYPEPKRGTYSRQACVGER